MFRISLTLVVLLLLLLLLRFCLQVVVEPPAHIKLVRDESGTAIEQAIQVLFVMAATVQWKLHEIQ